MTSKRLAEEARLLKKKAENLKITWRAKNIHSSSDFHELVGSIEDPEAAFNFLRDTKQLIKLILEENMNNNLGNIISKDNLKEIAEHVLMLKKRADKIREYIKCDSEQDAITVSFSDKEIDPWDLYYLISDVEQLTYLVSKKKCI